MTIKHLFHSFAALLLLAFLAYARALSFDFVYDDDIQVLFFEH